LVRVVLVRVWVAKVGEHAITHVFREEPIEAAYRLGDTGMIATDDLAQVFGIEPS
jgi:hypothetical protein